MKRESKRFYIILLVSSLLLIISLFYILPKFFLAMRVPINEDEIVVRCKNLSLTDTSECLVNNIKTFYSYNYTGNFVGYSLEQIKKNGGDCVDYSDLYARLGKKLNFNTKTVIIHLNDTDRHQIAILSNIDDYCILDQINYRCLAF